MSSANVSETVADRLGALIVNRPDFTALFEKLERTIVELFLVGESHDRISELEVTHLLRFADVLSHAQSTRYRGLAYATIANLIEYDGLLGFADDTSARIDAVAEAVLIQLGNFPGIRTLRKYRDSKFALPLSKEIVRFAKEITQKSYSGPYTFTDAQFDVLENIELGSSFSFSGPTSLGKSFVLKDFLFHAIQEEQLLGRSIVLLVPTKALITQTARDLRELLTSVPNVNVSTHPNLPPILREMYDRTIFVLTPERLIRYLSSPAREIAFLIVDEAHKVVAQNDTRSPLYYHAISQATLRYDTKLLFASPGIENPGLLLTLFDQTGSDSLTVRERTVAQHRYFVDLVKREQFHFSTLTGKAERANLDLREDNLIDLIIRLSRGRKSIIYVNGVNKAVSFARELASKMRGGEVPKNDDLQKFVRDHVHDRYYLAETIIKGVAFHHGKMPQDVRDRVEAAFADQSSPVQFVVCTSTLLEGVNLPAKNIFIISDRQGDRHFTKLNFENLAGRAGRLTYDFSGNVIAIREVEKQWKSGIDVLAPKEVPETIQSFLVAPSSRRRKEFSHMARVLKGEDLPNSAGLNAIQCSERYASILSYHQISGHNTRLRATFTEKIDGGKGLLEEATQSLELPREILARSPQIPPSIQDQIWKSLKAEQLPPLLPSSSDLNSTQTFVNVLDRLSSLYSWKTREIRGRDPLMRKNADDDEWRRRLTYWAILMRSWVNGDPTKLMIAKSISYYERQGSFAYRGPASDYHLVQIPFDPNPTELINLIIEKTLRDLEGGLRHVIFGYLRNYYDLIAASKGQEEEIEETNLAALVEFGTTEPIEMQLQEIGFSREVARELRSDYSDLVRMSPTGILTRLDYFSIIEDAALSMESRSELESIFGKFYD